MDNIPMRALSYLNFWYWSFKPGVNILLGSLDMQRSGFVKRRYSSKLVSIRTIKQTESRDNVIKMKLFKRMREKFKVPPFLTKYDKNYSTQRYNLCQKRWRSGAARPAAGECQTNLP